jgi:pimeloyl-ACP methyl ester carboxylesterase
MHRLFNMSKLTVGLMFAAAATFGVVPPSEAAVKPAPLTSLSYAFDSVPTKFVDVDGAHMAYRRYGKQGGVPLVFFQHFVGNLDSWDPKVIDGFARDREVIVFDNAGVGSSTGDVPKTVEAMAKQSIDFIHALGITQTDLLGFSLGSLVAQQVTLDAPDLVRRLVLVGSGPRGGVGMASLTPEFQGFLAKKRAVSQELLLDVFFTQSTDSQAAGRQFLERINARKVDRDADINDKVAPAQIAAFAAWGAPSANANDYLKAIKQPVLIVSGSNDIVHYTINSFHLQQSLGDGQLIIYPDSNHGSLYQYPDLFLKDVSVFLNQTK